MDIKPYTDLTKSYYHTEKIRIHHPEDRPRGKVHIKRVFKFPEGSREFNHIAKKIITTGPQNTSEQTTHGC